MWVGSGAWRRGGAPSGLNNAGARSAHQRSRHTGSQRVWVAGAPARLARRRRLCPSLFRARASARQSLAPRQQRRARQGQATYTVLGNMVSVDDMPVWVKDMEFLTEPLEGNKASFILKNSQRLRSYFQGRPGKIGQLFAIHDRHPPDTALDPQSGVLYFIRTEEGLQVLRCVSSLHALLALCQRLSGPAGCLGFPSFERIHSLHAEGLRWGWLDCRVSVLCD